MYQAAARGLPQRIPFVLTAGETSLYRLGPKLPDGAIIGARGPHSFFAHDSALNTWFQKVYVDRFHEQPVYPSYDFAQSLFGLKTAWEKAQAKQRRRAADDGRSDRRVRGHLVSDTEHDRADGARQRPPGHHRHGHRHL